MLQRTGKLRPQHAYMIVVFFFLLALWVVGIIIFFSIAQKFLGHLCRPIDYLVCCLVGSCGAGAILFSCHGIVAFSVLFISAFGEVLLFKFLFSFS